MRSKSWLHVVLLAGDSWSGLGTSTDAMSAKGIELGSW